MNALTFEERQKQLKPDGMGLWQVTFGIGKEYQLILEAGSESEAIFIFARVTHALYDPREIELLADNL